MSSYGQHAPSSSFQQDSALVAQFASQDHPERDPHPSAPSDIPRNVIWSDSVPYESRPKILTIGHPVHKPEAHTSTNERSPLLHKPSVSRISEAYEGGDGSNHDFDYRRTFFDEVRTLARYTLPVFGCVSLFLFRGGDRSHPVPYPCYRTHILEVQPITYRPRYVCSNNNLRQYSLLVAGTVSIGHISTKALAAATLASMTASVTGFSIMQGFLSSLDTLLPSAWTSSNPQLVGLWCQRVCKHPLKSTLAPHPKFTFRFSQLSSSSFYFS